MGFFDNVPPAQEGGDLKPSAGVNPVHTKGEWEATTTDAGNTTLKGEVVTVDCEEAGRTIFVTFTYFSEAMQKQYPGLARQNHPNFGHIATAMVEAIGAKKAGALFTLADVAAEINRLNEAGTPLNLFLAYTPGNPDGKYTRPGYKLTDRTSYETYLKAPTAFPLPRPEKGGGKKSGGGAASGGQGAQGGATGGEADIDW